MSRPVAWSLAALALATPVFAQDDPDKDRPSRSELEQRVRELERRVGDLERPAVEPDGDQRPVFAEGTHQTPEGFWPLPGTDFALKVGGWVKLDAIHDFDAIGNENKFATQTISVPEASANKTTFHPWETRLNLDVRGPVDGHDTRVFVETDFFGGGGGELQLRHAYFEIGGFLAGQTWTTYMDLSSRPHTLDYEGPDSELFIRQPMVRWRQGLADKTSLSVALEGASQDVSAAGAFTGQAGRPLPDLTANLRVECDCGHAQLSTVLRYLEFEGDPGTPDDTTLGWGVALSGKTELGDPGRRLMGQVSFGEGSARYNQAMRGSGSDAFLDPSGSLEALPMLTFVAGYEHDWCDTWTSTLAYSFADIDNEPTQAAAALARTTSASANVVWHPYEQFMTGVEYLYGTRENRDGQDGYAHRVMVSFKFLF